MKGKIIAALIVAALVAVVAFAVLVPPGVDKSRPMAVVTIDLKDDTNGNVLTADTNLGDPSNTLSVITPTVQMRPLTTYNQTVEVESTHHYSLALKAIFSYSGKYIKTYQDANFIVSGQKSINGQMYVLYTNAIISNVKAAGSPISGGSGVSNAAFFFNGTNSIAPTPGTDSTGMDPMDPFYCFGTPTFSGVLAPTLLLGSNLDMWVFHVKISVHGIGQTGANVTGTVSGELVLHASVIDTTAGITITVGGMSANVSDVGMPATVMIIPMCVVRE